MNGQLKSAVAAQIAQGGGALDALPNRQMDVPPRYAAFPPELRALPQWVVWKLVKRDGAAKPTKVPYAALTGGTAGTTDPSTWATFEDAAAACDANAAYAGIGFIFTEEDPYVGIDLDNCIDPMTGELTVEASSIVTAIGSYTERTPSGNGLHIIARGKLPPAGRKKGNIEMYESSRYFTVTGDQWPATHGAVEDRTAEVRALHSRVFGPAKTKKSAGSASHLSLVASNVTDDQALASIRSSANATKFDALFAGTWAPPTFPSQSEADLALCGILAAHCGGNTAQVDRLFRKSGLYRDKWDERRGTLTYGEKTIAKTHEENLELGIGGADNHVAAGDRAATIAKFNATFAVVRTGNGLRILEEHRDKSGRVGRVSFLKAADFGLVVKNWPILGQKHVNPGNWWLSQSDRREYNSIGFSPGGPKDGEYNLWQGFAVVGRAGDCHLFWTFVQEVICAGDAELYVYLRRYMAHAIQWPAERPEVGIVFRGGQGTGKNTCVEALGDLVAPHFCTLNQMDQVIGRFNGHLMNRLILHANEAIWGGNRSEAGKLKAMITDPTFLIEQKNVDVISIANYVRLFASSNEDWAVPIDFDDRRFVVFDVSDCHKQDTEYFAAIHAEMNNGGREALMYDLQNEDLKGFHPRAKPKARFGFDMKIRSANSVTRWLYESLDAGHLVGESDGKGAVGISDGKGWEAGYERDIIKFAYRFWCRFQNERHPVDASVLFKQIKKLLPDVGNARLKNKISGKRLWATTFPPLGDARLSFEKALNAEGQVEWQPEVTEESE